MRQPLDFTKPLRFCTNHKPVHYVGRDDQGRAIMQVAGTFNYFSVDECGASRDYWDLENAPEKIVRWIVAYPTYGLDTKEAAQKVADRHRDATYAVVRIEFEPGQRP